MAMLGYYNTDYKLLRCNSPDLPLVKRKQNKETCRKLEIKSAENSPFLNSRSKMHPPISQRHSLTHNLLAETRYLRKLQSQHDLLKRRSSISELQNEETERFLKLHKDNSVNAAREKCSTSRWHKITAAIKNVYEKSHIKSLFPIFLLVTYSLIGGFIIFQIESAHERNIITTKQNYLQGRRQEIWDTIFRVKALYENRTMTSSEGKLVLQDRCFWYISFLAYIHQPENGGKRSNSPGKDGPNYMFRRFDAIHQIYLDFFDSCWEMVVHRSIHKRGYERWFNGTLIYVEQKLNCTSKIEPMWTFWNAMFLAVQTYTTIGYGNIVAKTRAGKIVTIVYAIIGIPMVLMILHRLGRVFLHLLQRAWNMVVPCWRYIKCTCLRRQKKPTSKKSLVVLDTAKGRETYEVPVTLAVGVTFAWMFFCAAIFLSFEPDWDYFTSFYFFFISLTTIGFGDVVPSRATDMHIIFVLVIIGLALVSMSINVVQIKVESLFEELMVSMIEEYQQRIAADDGTEPPSPPMDGDFSFFSLLKMYRDRSRQGSILQQTTQPREQPQVSEGRIRGFPPPPVPPGITCGSPYENVVRSAQIPKRKRAAFMFEELRKKKNMKHKKTQTDSLPVDSVASQTAKWQGPSDRGGSGPGGDESGTDGPGPNFSDSGLHPHFSDDVTEISSQHGDEFMTMDEMEDPNLDGEGVDADRKLSSKSIDRNGPSLVKVHTAQVHQVPVNSIPEGELALNFAATSDIKPERLVNSRASVNSTSFESVDSFHNGNGVGSPGSSGPEVVAGGWTFVGAGKSGHKGRRGLVPAMYIHQKSHLPFAGDDFKVLIQQIDVRLNDCMNMCASKDDLANNVHNHEQVKK